MTYQWKIDGLFKGDATKCKTEIDAHTDGTAKGVVAYAHNRKTELHKCFEWNDTKAAEKYRLDQAREVLRSFDRVRINELGEEERVRVYERTSNKNNAVYRDVIEAFDDDEFKQRIIRRVMDDVEKAERTALSFQRFLNNPKCFKEAMKLAKQAI